MLIYHPDCELRLNDYGILIPVADDRSQKVFNALKKLYPQLEIQNFQDAISNKDLRRAHSDRFIDKLDNNQTLIKELEICFELFDENGEPHRYNKKIAEKNLTELYKTIRKQINYSYQSSEIALKKGFSYFLGGGFHHAMTFSGRGFCLLNDIAISSLKLLEERKMHSIWIIDVDAHKGDGTAEILKDNKAIKTLSLHMKNGWPLNMGSEKSPWFIPSTIDIGLEKNKESEYLNELKSGIERLLSDFSKPDLVIIVNGADPYDLDELESAREINLSKEQMLKRDLYLYEVFKEEKIPQSYLMAGGYGKHSWEIYFQFLKEVIIREGESFFQV